MEPILSIHEGKLKGKVCKDYEEKDYYSFQGIPYATPPLGKLRFMVSFRRIFCHSSKLRIFF